jgi:hypothetical protein
MPKTVVAGNALVITSELKLADLKTVKRYRPEALTLMGGKDGDDPIFTISTEGGAGINEYGAVFKDESRDGEGFACITAELTYSGDDLKGYIADKFGGALMHIGELEKVLPDVIKEIADQKKAVMEQITIA